MQNNSRLAENFFFFSFSGLFFTGLIAYGATRFACRLTSASAFAAADNRFFSRYRYGFDSFHNKPPHKSRRDYGQHAEFLLSLYTICDFFSTIITRFF